MFTLTQTRSWKNTAKRRNDNGRSPASLLQGRHGRKPQIAAAGHPSSPPSLLATVGGHGRAKPVAWTAVAGLTHLAPARVAPCVGVAAVLVTAMLAGLGVSAGAVRRGSGASRPGSSVCRAFGCEGVGVGAVARGSVFVRTRRSGSAGFQAAAREELSVLVAVGCGWWCWARPGQGLAAWLRRAGGWSTPTTSPATSSRTALVRLFGGPPRLVLVVAASGGSGAGARVAASGGSGGGIFVRLDPELRGGSPCSAPSDFGLVVCVAPAAALRGRCCNSKVRSPRLQSALRALQIWPPAGVRWRAWGASARLMYGCSPEPWWFLASCSAPLLLASMVLGGARWLALRPAGHWCIWRLVLILAVGGLREVRLAEAVRRASSSLEGSMAVVVGCRLAVGMCSNSGVRTLHRLC
ncbi:uncharacterized protein [Triticum aestivum]|uniref:uncharacterized protein n=1 Tax=Triticum aestivum TaxID=4565 RepID=UPI001D0263F1|nr:uncharacterized protein LOC123075954 [Triticum aestivum]